MDVGDPPNGGARTARGSLKNWWALKPALTCFCIGDRFGHGAVMEMAGRRFGGLNGYLESDSGSWLVSHEVLCCQKELLKRDIKNV